MEPSVCGSVGHQKLEIAHVYEDRIAQDQINLAVTSCLALCGIKL